MKKNAPRVLALLLISVWASLGHAELVVIVSNNSPLATITREQASHLFLRKMRRFPDGNAATPINLPKGEQRDAFYQWLVNKDRQQVNAYWSRMMFTGAGSPPAEVESEEAMVLRIANDPATIGYVDRKYVTNQVKVLLAE